MKAPASALKFLYPGWFSVVMGLAGLSLAWQRAVPLMGDGALAAALALAVVALVVFVLLAAASVARAMRHPQSCLDDLRHPVRHTLVATLPIALVLLATAAVAAGLVGPVVEGLWWLGSLGQLMATLWVLSRWWRGNQAGGLSWASVTPALFIPIVGNVLVPLAGVPLGRPEWSAAQFGIGLLFWPVVTVLLIARLALQGLWADRLLPSTFIFIAPPAAIGLSLLQFGAPALVGWGLWGMALFSLLWVASLVRRIVDQPFGLAHWGMSFPLAAFAALTLRLSPSGPFAMLGIGLLALTTLMVAAFMLATVRGLREGRLLAPEPIAIIGATPAGAA